MATADGRERPPDDREGEPRAQASATPSARRWDTATDDRVAWLWTGAVATFVVGDLLTTALGVSTGLTTEAHPVAAAMVSRFGLGSLVVVKVAVLTSLYSVWRRVPHTPETAVPAVLLAFGAAITLWNAGVLLVGAAGW